MSPTDICTDCSQTRREHEPPRSAVACQRFTLDYLGDTDHEAENEPAPIDIPAAISRAFEIYRDEHRHAPGLSASALGQCTRRAAYLMAGCIPSDTDNEGEGRAATIGTIIHEALMPYIARALAEQAPGGVDPVIEQPVSVRHGEIAVPGRPDVHHAGLVIDLKTGKAHPWHETQIDTYALAVAQETRSPVDRTALVYLDRTSLEVTVEERAFGPDEGLGVIARIEEISTYARNPDHAPRDHSGPGVSVYCDTCPFLRRCWGETAQPGRTGAQRILAVDDFEVEQAAASYDAARAEAKAADERKKHWAAVLRGRANAAYGDWYVGTGATKHVVNDAALKAFWLAHHPELPMTDQDGCLIVRPAKKPKQSAASPGATR